MVNTNYYMLNNELKNEGWLCDDTGVYVPYTHKNEEYHDYREIYLKISRQLRSNKLKYTYVKLEDGLFYPMAHYTSPALITEEDDYLIRRLSSKGNYCGLNTHKGVYINFVNSFKELINNADCLDILKCADFNFSNMENIINLTVDYEEDSHHNFIDMNNLILLVTEQGPIRFDKIYTEYNCPFGTDDIVKVSPNILRCSAEKKQYDQTGFLMKYYGISTIQEVGAKFQELMRNS